MGLKTTNYYIKKFDLTLPNAYAKLRTLVLNSDDRVNATFSIQQSREHCANYEPIDIIQLETKSIWDRTVPLEEFAYAAVKQETYDENKTIKTKRNALFGWTDDIVS